MSGAGSKRVAAIPLRLISLFGLHRIVGNFTLATRLIDRRFVHPWTDANASAAAALTRSLEYEAQAYGTCSRRIGKFKL